MPKYEGGRFSGGRFGHLGFRLGGLPQVITATSAPIMAALDDTETPADGYTAGSYASSEGTISSAVTTYLVNGGVEASSYDLDPSDVVWATVLVTDSVGNTRTFSTAQVTTTPSVALSNSAVPTISGTANVGQTLSTTDGSWLGTASRTFSYQWTRDGSDISGATANTYTLVGADDETDVGCTVTADDGFTQVAASATAASVTYVAPSAAAGLSDQSYTKDTGAQTVDASGDFTNAVGGTWSVSGASATINQSGVVSIPTATAIGATTVTVTYTNSGGSDSSAFSVTVVAPDLTAPVLSSAVNAAATFETSTWGVSTDEGNGTLYWVISTSGTAPTAAQVKAGQNNSGASAADSGSASVSGTGSQTGAGSGLTAETAYYTHFMHEDAAGNQSSVASATNFTTPSEVYDPATLFTGGEEGVAIDTALGALSSVGPVTAAGTGDGIALLIDSKDGASYSGGSFSGLGSELVTNGGFDTDSDWTKGGSWTISSGTASIGGASGTHNLSQASATPSVGSWCVIEFTISGRSAGRLDIYAGFTNLGSFSTDGTFQVVGQVTDNTTFTAQALGSFNGTIDNISVRHLPGDHINQTVVAERPDLTADGSFDFDGVDDNLTLLSSGLGRT